MPKLPRDKQLDSTLALIRDPYRFISKRCQMYQSDLFEARIMLHKTLCMTGPEMTALFYDEERFTRRGAAPAWLQKTLFGQGGVQGLDGEAHRHRKQMFLSLMARDRISQVGEIAAGWWRVYADKWTGSDRVVLYDDVNELLVRSVCAWAGVRLEESEVGRRTAELVAMFDQAAGLGRGHLWARVARRRAERWIEDQIEEVRTKRLSPPEDSALWAVAWHRDLKGELLDGRTAAVELLNVLRPTVATSVFIVMAALALHQYPVCRDQLLQAGDADYADLFVQEVRRFYPFFPAVMALVRHDFEWKGYRFPQGQRVILDLYGTNHDLRSWERPEEFRPERYRHAPPTPFNFIPQGGGDHLRNHRCPGEWIVIELMKVAVNFLASQMTYELPEQDLRIDFARLPALPRSRIIINRVGRPQQRKA